MLICHDDRANVDTEEKEESDTNPIMHARASINPKYVSVYQVLATGMEASPGATDQDVVDLTLPVCLCRRPDHVLHFDALAALLPSVGEEELAEALENVAVSLQGALLAKRYVVQTNLRCYRA